jgi:hypothetical protein
LADQAHIPDDGSLQRLDSAQCDASHDAWIASLHLSRWRRRGAEERKGGRARDGRRRCVTTTCCLFSHRTELSSSHGFRLGTRSPLFCLPVARLLEAEALGLPCTAEGSAPGVSVSKRSGPRGDGALRRSCSLLDAPLRRVHAASTEGPRRLFDSRRNPGPHGDLLPACLFFSSCANCKGSS